MLQMDDILKENTRFLSKVLNHQWLPEQLKYRFGIVSAAPQERSNNIPLRFIPSFGILVMVSLKAHISVQLTPYTMYVRICIMFFLIS